jgi:predicted MFS family arabinose efflux permease
METEAPESKTDLNTVSPRIAIIGPIAAYIAFVLELTLVPLLLPAMQSRFGLSVGDLAWVFNAYGISVAVGVLFGGWWGDAFSTRKVFAFGVALFTTGSFVAAGAANLETLIAGRILQGVGGGLFSPLVPILLTRVSPKSPGRTLIVWGSVAGYIAAFAPLVYGTFLGDYSWRAAFILNGGVAAIALVSLYGTQDTDDPDLGHNVTRKYSSLLQARDLWITFAYVFFTYGAISYYMFRLPVWLSNNGVDAASVGLVLSIMWLTFSGASALLRNSVDRPRVRAILLAAPLLIAAALPCWFYNANPSFLVLSSAFIGLGLACSNAPSTQMILRFAPKGMSAAATSLDITCARLGAIATVAIFAEVQVAYAAPAIGFMCLLAALCALTVNKRLASEGDPRELSIG